MGPRSENDYVEWTTLAKKGFTEVPSTLPPQYQKAMQFQLENVHLVFIQVENSTISKEIRFLLTLFGSL